jgi:Methyltransferase FkbM domain
LDAIVQESGVNRVDMIKIDVEGAELLVLKEAADTLDRYHPVVAVEMLETQLKNMATSAAEVIRFFRAHGYTPRHTYGEWENTEFAFTPSLSGSSK